VGGSVLGNPISGIFTLEWTLPENWPSDLSITLMDNTRKQAIPMDVLAQYAFNYRSAKSTSVLPEQPYLPERIVSPRIKTSALKADQTEPFTIVISRNRTDEHIYSAPTCQLLPVYPNPISENNVIRFTLPEKSEVVLQLLDIYGRKLETIAAREYSAGLQTLYWNADSYAPGTYFIRLQDRSSVSVQTILKSKGY
jgi:hypothetical protein